MKTILNNSELTKTIMQVLNNSSFCNDKDKNSIAHIVKDVIHKLNNKKVILGGADDDIDKLISNMIDIIFEMANSDVPITSKPTILPDSDLIPIKPTIVPDSDLIPIEPTVDLSTDTTSTDTGTGTGTPKPSMMNRLSSLIPSSLTSPKRSDDSNDYKMEDDKLCPPTTRKDDPNKKLNSIAYIDEIKTCIYEDGSSIKK